MIKIIAAVSQNGIIGNGSENKIPWSYPEDMKCFREKTSNSTIIMGRKTYESIGKPLPKRKNIVITNSKIDAVECFSSLEAAVEQNSDCWLIGGNKIYSDGLKYAGEIHITIIPEEIKGENLVSFPWINPLDFSYEFEKVIECQNNKKIASMLYKRKS